MDAYHLRNFFNFPDIEEPTFELISYSSQSSTSERSEDSGVGLLKEENLRKLQEQLNPFIYQIAPTRNLYYTNAQYPLVLEERGCTFIDAQDERAPSSLETIINALKVDRANPIPSEKAREMWDEVRVATSEALVAAVVTSDILSSSSIRRRDSDNRINLTGQWGNGFPLPSRNSEPNFLIAAPNPDATIGYNGENVGGYYKARDHLGDHCSPVKGDKQLLFPVVTAEVKGLNSDAYAQRQNM